MCLQAQYTTIILLLSQENIIFISFEDDLLCTYRLNNKIYENNLENFMFGSSSTFTLITGLSLTFNNKEYPLICDKINCILIDFESEIIYTKEFS